MSIFLEPADFITYETDFEKKFHDFIVNFMYSLDERGVKDISLRMNIASSSKKIFKLRTIQENLVNRWDDNGNLCRLRLKSEEIQSLPYVILTCQMQINYDTLDGYFDYTISKQVYTKSDLEAFVRQVVDTLQQNNISCHILDNLLLWCGEENK